MNKTITINYKEYDHYNELPSADQNMIEEAYKAAAKAYAPYSDFKVGAIAALQSGTLVAGSNQENIAYPSGLCAERTALFYAGANYPEDAVETLVIVAKGDLVKPDDCISPCGACRQVIAESEYRQQKPFRILIVAMSGRTFIFEKGTDLLIFAFGMH